MKDEGAVMVDWLSQIAAFQSAINNQQSAIKIAEPLSRYTTLRLGGPADALIEVTSAVELTDSVMAARQAGLPILMLGGGANVLVSDAGVRGLTIINKAKRIEFRDNGVVWCEAGTVLPTLARECVARGLSGLEWAGGVPGTVGGAVVGNAGAHGRDIAADLTSATILNSANEVVEWSNAELQFEYRGSRVKRDAGCRMQDARSRMQDAGCGMQEAGCGMQDAGCGMQDARSRMQEAGCGMQEAGCGMQEAGGGRQDAGGGRQDAGGQGHAPRTPHYVVLAATFQLTPGDPTELEARAAEFNNYRRRTQPPGASMGSMFKNPPAMAAGRLIDQCGLKGTRSGGAEISTVHANFFVNRGEATAADVKALIDLARAQVRDRFGIELELEIELVGEWSNSLVVW